MLLQARQRARMVTHSGAIAALLAAFAAPLLLALLLPRLAAFLARFMAFRALLPLFHALAAFGGRPLRLRCRPLRLRRLLLHLRCRRPNPRLFRRAAQQLVAIFGAALLLAPDLGAVAWMELGVALAHFGHAIGDAAAVRRIVLPAVRRCDHRAVHHLRRPVVVVVDVHHAHLALAPVEVAEEKARRNADRRCPPDTRRNTWAVRTRVAGPRCPDDRRIGRPPPRTVDQHRIVIGHVHIYRTGL